MTAVDTTTTTTTTTATQTGLQLVVGSTTSTQSVGNYVTDVSIAPYINPVIISFLAYNMRPNCLIHVFFDSVLVDQFCAPGIVETGSIDTSTYTSIPINGTWGQPIFTNSQGMVAGQFNIPGATFKTGDRVLELADVTSLAEGSNSITTQATATFTASNLNVTKQGITLTTVNPTFSTQSVTNTIVTSATSTNTTILPDLINVVNNVITNTVYNYVNTPEFWGVDGINFWQNDPLAQALTISTPNNQSGIFATSIDLYFQQTSQVANNGVTVYVCEMDNGYPNTQVILPFSKVHLPLSNVNVSNNASVATTFTFEAPVFMNNGVQYAFVIKPDANDPDYRVYTANVGDIDITTGVQVFSQPILGTAYMGATSDTWTALQTEYIKFNLFRATFMAAQGDAFFFNCNTDYISVSGINFSNSTVGLLPGDIIFQAANSLPASVNTSINGVFKFFDTVRDIVYVDNSSANFSNGSSVIQFHRFANATSMTPNTTTLIAFANTVQFYNPIVDAYVPQTAQITPAGTSIVYSYRGTSNSYVADTIENFVVPGTDNSFYDEERIVASVSNEVALGGGAKSFGLHANLTTTSSFVSPLIDLVRNQQLVLANEIDPLGFNYNEFYAFSNTKSKYVSQIVTLAPGQDSQDLQVSLTAHRPPGTAISVWVKYLNSEDPDPISAKTWAPMINQGSSLFSDPSNPNDYKEFNYVSASGYSALNTTGTITANASSANVVGVGTSFGSQVQVGWWINMAPNTTFTEQARQIISITNSTFLTLSAPFTASAGYSANVFYLVAPPTTAWRSTNTATQITGTITTSTNSNIIIGSGTNFLSQFQPGTIIDTAQDSQTVVSVTNSTSLTVGTAWSSAVTGANAFIVDPAGISYLNNNGALFNTFIQFQVKIVLQSNDTSKVPFLDDLRVLALQL